MSKLLLASVLLVLCGCGLPPLSHGTYNSYNPNYQNNTQHSPDYSDPWRHSQVPANGGQYVIPNAYGQGVGMNQNGQAVRY